MPRLNELGQWAAGVGNVAVSWTGGAIAQKGGDACWIARALIGFQREAVPPNPATGFPGKYDLQTYNVSTKAYATLAPTGAHKLAGGAGVWAAERAAGVFGTWEIAGAGLHDVGRDGTVGYCPVQQTGAGLILRAKDGETFTEFTATHGIVADVQVLSRIEAIWIERGRLTGTFGDAVIPHGRPWKPRAVSIGGRWFVLYGLTDAISERLIFQPWDEPTGQVLAEAKTQLGAYRPDVVPMPGGLARCAYSLTAGEGAANIRVRDVNPAGPNESLLREPVPPVGPPIATMKPPKVGLTNYSGFVQRGWSCDLQDVNDPRSTKFHVYIDADGLFRVRGDNDAGHDTSGPSRRAVP